MGHGERIRQQRQLLGWSQATLAKRVGANRSQVTEWETGKVEEPRFLRKIYEVLGLDENGVPKQPTHAASLNLRGMDNVTLLAHMGEVTAEIGRRLAESPPPDHASEVPDVLYEEGDEDRPDNESSAG